MEEIGAYRAKLLARGGGGAAHHAGDGAGALGGATGTSVTRVVTREEGSNGLKLRRPHAQSVAPP